MKPANILVDSDGNVRVSDFGLALAIDQDRLGENSIRKDPVEARRWLRTAGESGHLIAFVAYAEMLELGQGGPVDMAAARLIYMQVWSEGQRTRAGHRLVQMEALGEGTTTNRLQALTLAVQVLEKRNDPRSILWLLRAGQLDAKQLAIARESVSRLPETAAVQKVLFELARR